MKRLALTSIIAAALVLTSCGVGSRVTRQQAYPGMYSEKPLTLLIMPPVNNSGTPDAGKYLYTTLSTPLDEAGYYVLSPNIAWTEMQADGVDPKKLLYSDCSEFGKDYGADALVFSTISSWENDGLFIRTKIQYQIKSTRSNEVLFERDCDLVYDLTSGGLTFGAGYGYGHYGFGHSGYGRHYHESNVDASDAIGLLLGVALTAVNAALTPVAAAARECNIYAFHDLPRGKYSPMYQEDMSEPAGPVNVEEYTVD